VRAYRKIGFDGRRDGAIAVTEFRPNADASLTTRRACRRRLDPGNRARGGSTACREGHINLKDLEMIRTLMKAVMVLATGALFAMAWAPGMAEGGKPDATVSFSGASAAVGVAATWGKGTLHFRGKDYPFKLEGIGVVGVGGSAFEAAGEVFGLKKVEDFAGSYAAASAAAALEKGELVTTMRNQNGVVMRLKSTSKGAELKAAVEGVTVELSATGK
jgi:hypothetical protein